MFVLCTDEDLRCTHMLEGMQRLEEEHALQMSLLLAQQEREQQRLCLVRLWNRIFSPRCLMQPMCFSPSIWEYLINLQKFGFPTFDIQIVKCACLRTCVCTLRSSWTQSIDPTATTTGPWATAAQRWAPPVQLVRRLTACQGTVKVLACKYPTDRSRGSSVVISSFKLTFSLQVFQVLWAQEFPLPPSSLQPTCGGRRGRQTNLERG